jgi:hypothetical protein
VERTIELLLNIVAACLYNNRGRTLAYFIFDAAFYTFPHSYLTEDGNRFGKLITLVIFVCLSILMEPLVYLDIVEKGNCCTAEACKEYYSAEAF